MITGSLLYGVDYEGVVHRDFSVRLPVVKDTIAALEASAAKFEDAESAAAGCYYRIAMMASVLVSLGTIPTEAITANLLYEQLVDDDLALLDKAIRDAKKKRLPQSSA